MNGHALPYKAPSLEPPFHSYDIVYILLISCSNECFISVTVLVYQTRPRMKSSKNWLDGYGNGIVL